jgi:hypothetical protein
MDDQEDEEETAAYFRAPGVYELRRQTKCDAAGMEEAGQLEVCFERKSMRRRRSRKICSRFSTFVVILLLRDHRAS